LLISKSSFLSRIVESAQLAKVEIAAELHFACQAAIVQ